MSPLIRDKVATLKTQGHCMLEDIRCTKISNPGQTPVSCIEMSPFIHAKCSQKAGMTCFSDLAIVLYYEIMRLGVDYNRTDIVFLFIILMIA